MRLVDADDLLTAFPIGDEPTVTIACIRATIKHMPTIEERKTGKWISLDDSRGKYNDYGYKCSECGEHSDYEENFCPNCGADMRGEEDG